MVSNILWLETGADFANVCLLQYCGRKFSALRVRLLLLHHHERTSGEMVVQYTYVRLKPQGKIDGCGKLLDRTKESPG